MMKADHRKDTPRRAFTLIELLASMAILSLIMVMLFSAFEQISKAWTNGENRVETFTQARAVLDLMSRELSQAIATSKIAINGQDNTHVYFVAPLNNDPANQSDLCEVGYEYAFTPGIPGTPYTSTLTRKLTEPTNANIGSSIWNIYAALWWNGFDNTKDAILANDTILSLTFQYWDPAANKFVNTYSGNKVPLAIQIVLDAVDSHTVARLKLVPNPVGGTAWVPITNATLRSFSTIVYLPNTTP
jgi:prepilin-type N-terminal cleavage/methylation domain-containing protein